MPANSTIKETARFLIDAFDVDIQFYIGKLMKQLSGTPSGLRFAEWAKSNPVPFEAFIRLVKYRDTSHISNKQLTRLSGNYSLTGIS